MGARRSVGHRSQRRCTSLRADLDGSLSPLFRVPGRQSSSHVRSRRGVAGPCLGQRSAGLDPRRGARLQLSARARRDTRRPARGIRIPDPAARRSAERDGVLQPRDPRARCGSALDAHERRQPDRAVRRPEARAGGARLFLHALARHALHRRIRRLLQARQSGVAPRSRLQRRGAAVAALHGLRPSRRSRRPRLPNR